MLLCGWFPGACGDLQLIRPNAGRAAAPRAHPDRLAADWFRRACDGRLRILLPGRPEMHSQARLENGPRNLSMTKGNRPCP